MKFAIVSFGLLFPLLSFAAPSDSVHVDDHIRSKDHRQLAPVQHLERPLALTSGTFQQNIDHFGQLSGQLFGQRYWVDSEYVQATQSDDAPVIFHICGEGDVEQSYFLQDNAVAWAQALGAHLVYLEHRYYGQSLPFPDLSTDHLTYLTLGNAIEDLATFQKWVVATQGWKGPWISVGGSYSGTLSALYRQAHPELVIGALASSAPMISGVGQAVGSQDDVDDYASTDPSDDSGGRQWIYQACTGLGFWQADGEHISSSLEIPSSWLCQQLFGNAALVDPTAYNQSYDQPFLSGAAGAPSNILFTYGSDDVWTNLGLSQQTNSNPGITLLVIDGAGHHFDLNAADPSDSQAVINARTEFTTLAQGWLNAR
jgi:pimeloyl-ACP methyl ester carboxylesterase